MHRYRTFNGPMPTTAPIAAVTTGTATKTMLQLATPSTRQIQLIAWGFSVTGAQVGSVELLQTDVAATVTAHAASGIYGLMPGQPASLLTLGTSATGYSASVEGTPAATRLFDLVDMVGVTDGHVYRYQFMPSEMPIVAASTFLRIRATFGTAVTMTTFVEWDE